MLVRSWGAAAKGCLFRRSACILLSLIHLLLELLGLLFVDEAQPSQAFLEFESMEESTVLIVMPRIENLLIPDNSAT